MATTKMARPNRGRGGAFKVPMVDPSGKYIAGRVRFTGRKTLLSLLACRTKDIASAALSAAGVHCCTALRPNVLASTILFAATGFPVDKSMEGPYEAFQCTMGATRNFGIETGYGGTTAGAAPSPVATHFDTNDVYTLNMSASVNAPA